MYIGIGTKFKLNERFYEVMEEMEKNTYLARDLDFLTTRRIFSLTEMYKYLEAGVLEFQLDSNGKKNKSDFHDFSMLPVKLQEEAKYRHFVIKPLLQLRGEKLKPYIQDRLKQLSDSGYKVSERSIYRWLSDYTKSEDSIESLVSNTQDSGPRNKLIQGEIDLIIEEVMNTHYKRRELSNPKNVYYAVIHKIDIENLTRKEGEEKLKYPSISTIRRRIKESDSYDRDKQRIGHAEARKKHGSVQMLNNVKHPLQRVEIDHTPLDLILVDKNGIVLDRPTVTTALDKYTGYPLGIYVGFEPASYTAVMYCLLHAFAPKSYLKERYPSVQNEWLAYGLPELLVTDRGKEFKSKHLNEACFQLDIQLTFNPPRKPWYKGSIERHFRTLNEGLVHQLPGTTFSNVVKKGDYDSEKHASLTLDEFLEHLHIFIVDIYAKEPRGNKLSPARMWEKAIENGFTPSIPSFKLDWKVALMKLGTGSIQSTGVQKDYLFYQSPDLQGLRSQLGLKGKGYKIKYKYDPSDLSKIYVYDELKKEYIEAMCTDQEYSLNLSEYSHRVFVANARLEGNNRTNMSEIAAARARSDEKIKNSVLKKKERQQAARMANEGSNELLKEKAKAKEIGKVKNEEIFGETNSLPNKLEDDERKELDFDQDWEAYEVDY
ncbi:DDE-type integrase/transposase/recombinase [uncultured Psychrobacillus sp.]|uniref:Mu transposase C-terminal domain-containing protein n=1 Tax=uncultured Psychrobacillus sp. TaxID=1551585 RepID=UPI00261EBD8E|nr:DDE-type integrase/transposase/recombinase [uncultured Psychrobacillus sp.]